MPYLTLTPPSGWALSVTKAPLEGSTEPNCTPVATGMISRLRLIERSVIPSSSPIWGRKPDTPREIGAQTAFSSFCRISRTIWNAQRCGTSRPRCGVAQALERNRHLRREAVVDDLRAAVEQRVPRAVAERNARAPETATAAAAAAAAATAAAAPAARVDDLVALHVVAVDREGVGALLIEERVQVDGDVVVAPRLIAIHPCRPHDAGIVVVRVHRHVQILAVVADPDLGFLAGRRALERRLLHELGHAHRVPPNQVVEAAVDVGADVRTRGAQRGTAGQDAGGGGEPGGRSALAARPGRRPPARRFR